MARFAERAAADRLTGQEIVDQLAAWLAGQYQQAETDLLRMIAERVAKDMTVDDQTRRVAAIQALRTEAADRLEALNTEHLARRVVDTAIAEGEAAALEQLGIGQAARAATAPGVWAGQAVPFATGITPTSAIAAAQIGLELSNALTDVRARILRLTPDIYQETIARFAGQRVLGVTTGRQTRAAAVTEWIAQGIPGFVDASGREWSPGAYVEMATRTATNRAWLGAHEARWDAMGLDLVTIVRGSDSCQACATWSGRILTNGGPVGPVEREHATTGEPITVNVEGTLADARAAGWNHPNCRCTLAPVFPGLSLPANDSTYDPQAEKDRDHLRYLERRVREYKKRAAVAEGLGDDVAAKGWARRAREEQARIREHVAKTGQVRKPYREQLAFSGTAPNPPRPTAIVPPAPIPTPPPAALASRTTTPAWAKSSPRYAVDGLAERTRRAALSGDQLDALGQYVTNGAYEPVNALLRGRTPNAQFGGLTAGLGDPGNAGYMAQLVGDLDSAIDSVRTEYPLTLFRGMDADALGKMKRGTVFTDPGFVSTSTDAAVTAEFGSYVLRIDYPIGRPALSIDAIDQIDTLGQSEVLLPRGTTFRVVSTNERDGVTVVNVEAI